MGFLNVWVMYTDIAVDEYGHDLHHTKVFVVIECFKQAQINMIE